MSPTLATRAWKLRRKSATASFARPATSPADQLGTCDDADFSPFANDQSTSRQNAFAKVRARVEGTKQAAEALAGT
ncbi:hypothetical protein [Streptomyces lydicus]|uniref:hypothetical protein n=1 Tax=Streptomyces lydicus TaxID=47763 RepID=UPI00101080F4|nr:hypothetical protein [Streptomyces lydicus]MDC7340915.1 hypothetical protein [Streptomyces lydicus]UEG89396.1 hypothetical protein LJ741_01955 [Streptomyces lydicus]